MALSDGLSGGINYYFDAKPTADCRHLLATCSSGGSDWSDICELERRSEAVCQSADGGADAGDGCMRTCGTNFAVGDVVQELNGPFAEYPMGLTATAVHVHDPRASRSQGHLRSAPPVH